MRLAQKLLEAGVFSGAELTPELREELEQIFHPQDGTIGDQFRDPRALQVACRGTSFYLYDHWGYIGRADTIEALVILLMFSEVGERGARAIVLPLAHAQPTTLPEVPAAPPKNLEELRARAAAMRQQAESKIGAVRGSPGSGLESGIEPSDGPVRTIGIGDGPPNFRPRG